MKPRIKYSQSYRVSHDEPNFTEIPKGVVLINDWSTCYSPSNSPYTPPELLETSLQGTPYNHPNKSLNGRHIITSPIVRVQDRDVYTRSGTHYRLGYVNAEFHAWLIEHQPNWDPSNPITMKGGVK